MKQDQNPLQWIIDKDTEEERTMKILNRIVIKLIVALLATLGLIWFIFALAVDAGGKLQ